MNAGVIVCLEDRRTRGSLTRHQGWRASALFGNRATSLSSCDLAAIDVGLARSARIVSSGIDMSRARNPRALGTASRTRQRVCLIGV